MILRAGVPARDRQRGRHAGPPGLRRSSSSGARTSAMPSPSTRRCSTAPASSVRRWPAWRSRRSASGRAFAINALSFLAVIVGLLMIDEDDAARSRRGSTDPTRRERSCTTSRKACATSGRRQVVLLAVVAVGVVATVGMNFNVLIPAFAQDELGERRRRLRLPDGRVRGRVADGRACGSCSVAGRGRSGSRPAR